MNEETTALVNQLIDELRTIYRSRKMSPPHLPLSVVEDLALCIMDARTSTIPGPRGFVSNNEFLLSCSDFFTEEYGMSIVSMEEAKHSMTGNTMVKVVQEVKPDSVN